MNVVVIAAHGCPVGCLGAYGNEWIATPNLDRLAAEGTTFDRHYAARPDPLAARREWWGVGEDLTPPAPLPSQGRGEEETPPSLGGKGVGGLGLHSVILRASRPAFDAPPDYYAPFAEVFDARPEPGGDSPFDPLLRQLPKTFDRLASRSDQLVWIETDQLLPPWFAPQDVFDLYCEDLTEDEDADPDAEPLLPWTDPPVGRFDRDDSAAWELLHRTFATAVSSFDADLGRLFDLLREYGWDRTATWAFTSDFGYPLGEHGIVGPCRPWLYEEFVHLPLIVRRPGGAGAGRRVWDFTQPEDVLKNLTPQPPSLGGKGESDSPPFPPREGGPGGLGLFRNSVISLAEIAGRREAALRTDTHALLLPLRPSDDEPREPLLFEKPDDRWEVNDVRVPNLDLADAMEAELRGRLS